MGYREIVAEAKRLPLVVSAQAEALDALITRDPDDYKGVDFPILSPPTCLEQLSPA